MKITIYSWSTNLRSTRLYPLLVDSATDICPHFFLQASIRCAITRRWSTIAVVARTLANAVQRTLRRCWRRQVAQARRRATLRKTLPSCEPQIEGKTSINAYQKAAQEAWTDYRRRGGRELTEFAAFCYH